MIAFKNGSEKALERIRDKVIEQVDYSVRVNYGAPTTDALKYVIADAITAGIQEMIKQQYSDDDFETDMELKT